MENIKEEKQKPKSYFSIPKARVHVGEEKRAKRRKKRKKKEEEKSKNHVCLCLVTMGNWIIKLWYGE